MSIFINGVEHWRYPVRLVIDSASQLVKSSPGAIKAPGSSAALTVYDLNQQPLQVQTNSQGLTQELYAPVFPFVDIDLGAVGPGGEQVRQSIVSDEVASTLAAIAPQLDALGTLATSVSQLQALLGVNPQGVYGNVADRIEVLEDELDTVKEQLAAGGGGGTTPPGGGGGEPTRAPEGFLSHVRFEITVPTTTTPPPPVDTGAIPATDGPGKWRFGGNHDDAAPDDDGAGTSGGGQYNGQRITTLDKRIYSSKRADGSLTAPAARCGYVREYFDGPVQMTGNAKLEGWNREGRRGLWTFKRGAWSLEQFANRDAGAVAALRSLARWFKTLPAAAAAAGKGGDGEHDLSFWHEPEEFMVNLTDARLYRKAYRTCVEVFEEEGCTNVAWTAPMYVAVNDFKNKDFRLCHPEWDDNLRPILKADGSRRPYVVKFGIDWYNPHVNVATNRIDGVPQKAGEVEDNHTWKEDVTDTILADYLEKGGRPMPMVIGEFGLYTSYHGGGYGASLESTGVTVDLILSDMIDDGVLNDQFPVTGIAFWNSNECRFSDDKDWKRNPSDLFGIKTTAVRQVANGYVLRTNAQSPRGAGKRVLPSDAQAHRSWVMHPQGNRTVSAQA